MGKIQFKQSNDLISVIRILQSQMLLNAQVTQIRRLSQKTPKKLHKLVLADRKLKLREIAEELKISEGSVFTILNEYLSMRKLCSKWVPHLLTVDQKQQCIVDLKRCLQLFQAKKRSEYM